MIRLIWKTSSGGKKMKKQIAIIGGGIAGLTAAYLLNRKYDITLFEKDERLGGNAHTLKTKDDFNFDIAVAVFGKKSYTYFNKLLNELNVETVPFSSGAINLHNLETKTGLYITPFHLKALWTQKFAMLKPYNVLSIIGGIPPMVMGRWLNRSGKIEDMTMKEFFETVPNFYGRSKLFTMFMFCIVTSMYYEEVLEAPASFIFNKIETHKDFFTHRNIYSLYHSKNNTAAYVNAIASHFKDKIILNADINSIERKEGEITIKRKDGSKSKFDHVVFACNADQALALLERPNDIENKLLSAWKYKDGPIVVHKDTSHLPDRNLCKLYSCVYTKDEEKVHTSITGHVWNLKNVPDDCPYSSTQHPNFPIDKEMIEYKKIFRTPIFDKTSVAAIKHLPLLNENDNTYYCGSHFGYGLHEDAVNSAANVAKRLGVNWN